MPRPIGVLLVKVVEAKSLIQTDSAFMSIDPYVAVSLGATERRTTVGNGNNPSWNEAMEFPTEVPDSEELQLMVHDQGGDSPNTA
jgi:Ca2+-dependent lipid-binding protein